MRGWYWNCRKKDSAIFKKMSYTMSNVRVSKHFMEMSLKKEREE